MRIDPHTHSSYSDGTDTPAQLLAHAAQAGLDVLGLTDHDTTSGWESAVKAVPATGVTLLRGAEISCMDQQGVTLHLLAYLFDPHHAELAAALTRARTSRQTRAQRIVARLSQDYPITWRDVLAHSAQAKTLGRPHIADALVAAGCFPNRAAVFAGPLAVGSPYYVGHWALDPVYACQLVRAAGGVPVAAHPRAARRQQRLVAEETFARMAQAGLAALEAYHPDHTWAQQQETCALARRLGLAVSGSSDYHGKGKPNRLGQCLMPPQLLEQICAEGVLPLVQP